MARFPSLGESARSETAAGPGSSQARRTGFHQWTARWVWSKIPLLALIFCLAAGAAAISAAAQPASPANAQPAVSNLSMQLAPASAVLQQAPASTSALSVTTSPTSSETPTPHRRPTRTPRPTATPMVNPPPSDPGFTRVMVGFGVLIVLVIGFGVWINRKTAF